MSYKTLRLRSAFAAIALLAVLFGPVLAIAQAAKAPRIVQGRVVGETEEPVAGAVVYLKDLRKLTIKSYISAADGTYRFGQLNPDTDYELWADHKGKKSPTKTVSSFDTKKVLDINLRLK